MEPIVFDSIELQEQPVHVGSTKYVLREASGSAAAAYRNALFDCAEMGPEGKPARFSGIARAVG